MKVMLVNGSSHLHGTTMTALEEMIKVFHSEEVETEVVQLGGKSIADCLQCNVCQKTGKCVIKDDGVNEFVEKAKTADGFVFATPVYFAHPSGRIYDFLDRAFYSAGGYDAFKFKPGAAVAVARRGGTTAALDGINKYFGIAQMPVAGSTYWNMVHGLYGEEASQDEEGTASLSRIHSLSTLTGASRHSLLVPASEYISLTFFLIVRLLILHGSGFRCAALGCIRSLFLRAPLTCRLLSVRVYPPLLLPFIAFAYWLYFLCLLLC